MNLLTSIISSDWFVIVAIVWGIIAIASRDERDLLMNTIGELITKPIIFHKDENSGSVKFYPRQFLETVAKLLTSGILGVASNLIGFGASWRKKLEGRFSKNENVRSWRMMGSVILLFSMFAFLYADLIAIFNTLEVLGLVTTIPPIFRHYEYAVTFGSFFTIVLAGLILIELFGTSIFTDIANQPRPARILLTWVSIVLVVSGIAVAISLGLIRYQALTNLGQFTNTNLDNFNNLVITILVPVNTIISTFLVVSEGLKGLPIVGNLLVQITIYMAVAILFAFSTINYPIWFGIDIGYRVALMGIYIIFFYLLTPLDRILSWKPFADERTQPSKDNNATLPADTVEKKKV